MTSGLPRLAECRTCTQPIRFVKLDTGRAMPVNPQPTPDGNVAAALIGGQLHGHVIAREKPARPSQRYRFRTHYATCETKPKRDPKPTAPVEIPDPSLW